MRKLLLFICISIFLFPSCSKKSSGNTIPVVKPKYHHWWFNKKKDKRKKRTKVVRMKS